MFLVWLLKNVVYRLLCPDVDTEVSDIIYDSRKMAAGCVFVCLKGYAADGHDYAEDVMGKGAAAVVIQNDLPREKKSRLTELAEENGVCLLSVEDTRKALGEMSRAFFGYPEKKLTMIGITGTKGKTTVAGIVKSIFDAAGIFTGVMGTLGVTTGKRSFETDNTTPESYLVQKYLRMMVDDGCQAAVMEVSSQALMCGRVEGVCFDYAIMTNISPDHIGPGEHHSFEEYIYWKGRLFTQCHIGIANGADIHVKEALKECRCYLETFGVNKGTKPDGCCESNTADVGAVCGVHTQTAMNCAKGASDFDWMAQKERMVSVPEPGTSFETVWYDRARSGGGRGSEDGLRKETFFLSLPGDYNVCNALPAIAVARHMGISCDAIRRGLSSVKVRGRCEVLKTAGGGYFILDYAHNGRSLETVLATLRKYRPKRLICIFGCGGNRSKLRRIHMARAAARGADLLIVTTDNPRYEAPREIIGDIEAELQRLIKEGQVRQGPGFYKIIEDRRAAIRYALSIMERGDIVLLAGKGHETYQEIAGQKYPFDEHVIVREEMRRLAEEGRVPKHRALCNAPEKSRE